MQDFTIIIITKPVCSEIYLDNQKSTKWGLIFETAVLYKQFMYMEFLQVCLYLHASVYLLHGHDENKLFLLPIINF